MNQQFRERVSGWLASCVNKAFDLDGYYGAQCYDLANKYALDIVGSGRFIGLYAADIISQPGAKYRRINNTSSFVPQIGDIAVWNKNLGGGAGHVGICTGEGDTSYFVSLDQNWNKPAATYVRHNYDNFIGVLRPLAAEIANSTPSTAVPTPSADNEGIVNGQGLRGRVEPNMNASSPWYFDDLERITLIGRKKGQMVTSGPYAPSDWWYLAQGRDKPEAPRVWVSDAFVRTTKNPANVPDYVSDPLKPGPIPEPVNYAFTKDVDCVTEVKPAGKGNYEVGNFPDKPDKAVIHDFGARGVDTIGSLINTFTKSGTAVSSHFAVSGKKIVQLVSLKDRAYHAGANGNSYIGIETDPAQDLDTIGSAKVLLKQLRSKYGSQLLLIEHNSIMPTSCGDDVDLKNYDITDPGPITPNPPADPTITDRLTVIEATLKYIQDFLTGLFINYRRK